MSGNSMVTLEAKLDSRANDSVAISYVVRNLRAGKIYVFNVLFHTDVQGNRTVDPELAYVFQSEDHGIVAGKFEIAVPPGMRPESPEIPYLDPLEAGQTLAGKITLRLPLHVFHPYLPPSGVELNLAANKLLVQIGFIDATRAAPKEALIEPAHGTGAGHFQCDYGLGLKYQEMLTQEIALPHTAR